MERQLVGDGALSRLERVLLVVPLLLISWMGWQRRWVTDDAFIHLRVVQQFLHGNGPVFNAGERVEASTSPLWVFVLAGVRLVLGFVPLEWIAVILVVPYGRRPRDGRTWWRPVAPRRTARIDAAVRRARRCCVAAFLGFRDLW
ncbi:MAG: hypothetical protein JOZ99_09165, partial [Actinobacteria bacterium]|nr:hypothetical protein [Actinomycetota bacterium]